VQKQCSNIEQLSQIKAETVLATTDKLNRRVKRRLYSFISDYGYQ